MCPMKIIFLFLALFCAALLACTGDCVSCHPKLNVTTDVRHTPLATCITCHTKESLLGVDMGAACGQDCFACHSADKITQSGVIEHQSIGSCIACHTTLKKETFMAPSNPFGIPLKP